jgi:hypothetical protein
MNQTVHAVFQINKSAKSSHSNNFTLNQTTNRILSSHIIPRIIINILQGKGYLILFRADIYNRYRNLIAHGKHIRNLAHTPPGQFRNMNQSIDSA